MSCMEQRKFPRHMRLFELLRQKSNAETIVARSKGFSTRQISVGEVEHIKAMAQQSLARCT